MKTVLITGGAGGIGRAICEAFAHDGWRVFCCDLHSMKEPIEGVTELEMDVANAESVEQCYQKVCALTDKLDLIMPIAGVFTMGSFVEISEQELKRVLNVNVMGVYRVNKTFLPLLGEGGRIFIITSELAPLKPLPFNGIYAFSKTSLESYALSLRLELMLLGITVCVFRPGAFQTDMVKSTQGATQRLVEQTELYKEYTKRFQRIISSQTGGAKPPKRLAGRILHAAKAKKPRPIYTINAGFLLKIYNLIPYRTQAWVLKKLLKKRNS